MPAFAIPKPVPRAAFVDTANISVRSIALELAGGSDQIITARYRLHANREGDRRAASIDFSECPLWPLSVEGTLSETVTYDSDAEVVLENTRLNLRKDAASWDDSEIVIRLRWAEKFAHPPLSDQGYLFLPADLPFVGRGYDPRTLPTIRTYLQLAASFDRLLVGAVGLETKGSLDENCALLQAVLGRKHEFAWASRDQETQVRLESLASAAPSSDTIAFIDETIRGMCDFYVDRFELSPKLRIGAALQSTRKSRAMAGALLTEPLSRYRRPTPESEPNPFHIARQIATNWWGVGCRVHGARGFYLDGGIAFAAGLAWMERNIADEPFGGVLEFYKERLVAESRFWPKPFQPGERTIGIGLVIFDALRDSPKVWRVLQELTNEFWGRFAPEEIVIAHLEGAGVPTRDFVRKRFHRPERNDQA